MTALGGAGTQQRVPGLVAEQDDPGAPGKRGKASRGATEPGRGEAERPKRRLWGQQKLQESLGAPFRVPPEVEG